MISTYSSSSSSPSSSSSHVGYRNHLHHPKHIEQAAVSSFSNVNNKFTYSLIRDGCNNRAQCMEFRNRGKWEITRRENCHNLHSNFMLIYAMAWSQTLAGVELMMLVLTAWISYEHFASRNTPAHLPCCTCGIACFGSRAFQSIPKMEYIIHLLEPVIGHNWSSHGCRVMGFGWNVVLCG